MKNTATFTYEANNGTFGTFVFDRHTYSMLKTVEGMPNIDFDKSITHISVTPKTLDALCILCDFVNTNFKED